MIGVATWAARQLSDQVVRSLTASKITSGRLSVGTEITVGDPSMAHLSIGGTALRVWRPDSDGGLRTTIQLGGADRDVIQITDPDTGATVAGFTDEGDVVGRDAAFEQVTVGGRSLGWYEWEDDALWRFTRGTTGYRMPDTPLADSPTAGGTPLGAFETSAWCQGGRIYRAEFVGTVNLPDTGMPTSYVQLRYTLDGQAPTVTSPVLQNVSLNWQTNSGGVLADGGQSQQANVSAYLQAGTDANLYYLVRCLVTFYRRRTASVQSGTVRVLSTAINPSFVTITDCGPVGAAFLAEGQMSGGGGTSPGGTAPTPPPPPAEGKRTVTSTYNATWGRTWYVNDGRVRTDVGSDLIAGYWSYGNVSSIGFPAQVAADIAGATVSKIEVYLYAYHWGLTTGTAYIGVHGDASLPASFSYSGIHQEGGWKRGEGRWVTLPATWYPAFITGVNKGVTLGGGAPQSNAVYGKFRGYNHAQNPKLRITYTK